MITRRKDYTKREPSKNASKIYIICEGTGTEPDYFNFFKGLSSNLELIIIPPEKGTDPMKLMKLAENLLLGETGRYSLDYMQNDQVWFAIDTDSWEQEDKIRPLRDFCQRQNEAIPEKYDEVKAYPAWNVAQSNPCFEIWLYYHHYDTAPDENEVQEHPSIKAYVNRCISGGFNYQNDQVKLEDAIDHSERNFSRQKNGNPALYATEEFLLGKEILSFVKPEIQKLRNKMG